MSEIKVGSKIITRKGGQIPGTVDKIDDDGTVHFTHSKQSYDGITKKMRNKTYKTHISNVQLNEYREHPKDIEHKIERERLERKIEADRPKQQQSKKSSGGVNWVKLPNHPSINRFRGDALDRITRPRGYNEETLYETPAEETGNLKNAFKKLYGSKKNYSVFVKHGDNERQVYSRGKNAKDAIARVKKSLTGSEKRWASVFAESLEEGQTVKMGRSKPKKKYTVVPSQAQDFSDDDMNESYVYINERRQGLLNRIKNAGKTIKTVLQNTDESVEQIDELTGKGQLGSIYKTYKDRESEALDRRDDAKRRLDRDGSEEATGQAARAKAGKNRAAALMKVQVSKNKSTALKNAAKARDKQRDLTDTPTNRALDRKMHDTKQGTLARFMKAKKIKESVEQLDELAGKGSLPAIDKYHQDQARRMKKDSDENLYHGTASYRAKKLYNIATRTGIRGNESSTRQPIDQHDVNNEKMIAQAMKDRMHKRRDIIRQRDANRAATGKKPYNPVRK